MADLAQAFSEVKSLPDHMLEQELSSPSGMIPGWLALGEMHERKALRATTGGADPTKRPSMAEQYAGSIAKTVAGAGVRPQQMQPQGGIPGGMPPTQPGPGMPPQQGGISALPQQQPQGYAGGGIVSLANGNPLLAALLRNESGGRNIANTSQGTSSGQAQGYFQITTGTWDDFGGRKYAPNPMKASPEQQWDIASRIPLKRWDTSTLDAMRKTGQSIDPNRTLGENIGQNFTLGTAADGGQANAPTPVAVTQVDPTTADVVTDAATKAGTEAGTEMAAGGSDPMSQMLMMSQLMGGKGQPAAAPPPAQQMAVGKPVDASVYVQNPVFMERMRRSGYG
jgi:transglycosylase-like protein